MDLPLQDLVPIFAAGWTILERMCIFYTITPKHKNMPTRNVGKARGRAAGIRPKSKGGHREGAGGNEGFRWEAAAFCFL